MRIINILTYLDDLNKLEKYESIDRSDAKDMTEKLYKGFIEILYKLRNALFHSEVEPNKDVMKVYKLTYFILRKIIHKIPT
ncbi:MAG: hypothetical protein ACI8TE_001011 [Francisella sp.]|jgi:hypothetical protein